MPQRAPFAQGTVIGPEQLSTLLDSVQELIAILSPDGIIQFASPGFTRLLGHALKILPANRSLTCFT
jgi:PAS domain-containing protein